jgi:hemolysin-activating ACP:hemolysin acyltransferase
MVGVTNKNTASYAKTKRTDWREGRRTWVVEMMAMNNNNRKRKRKRKKRREKQ